MIVKRSAFPFVHAPRREAVTPLTSTPPRHVDGPRQRFAQALQLLEEGQWQEAFGALSGLANDGHPAAARIALMMVRRGPSLFGGHFSASRQERARWQHDGEA